MRPRRFVRQLPDQSCSVKPRYPWQARCNSSKKPRRKQACILTEHRGILFIKGGSHSASSNESVPWQTIVRIHAAREEHVARHGRWSSTPVGEYYIAANFNNGATLATLGDWHQALLRKSEGEVPTEWRAWPAAARQSRTRAPSLRSNRPRLLFRQRCGQGLLVVQTFDSAILECWRAT